MFFRPYIFFLCYMFLCACCFSLVIFYFVSNRMLFSSIPGSTKSQLFEHLSRVHLKLAREESLVQQKIGYSQSALFVFFFVVFVCTRVMLLFCRLRYFYFLFVLHYLQLFFPIVTSGHCFVFVVDFESKVFAFLDSFHDKNSDFHQRLKNRLVSVAILFLF